jgi:hypothetical protein
LNNKWVNSRVNSSIQSRNNETPRFKLPESNFKRVLRDECKCNQSFRKFAFSVAHREAFLIYMFIQPRHQPRHRYPETTFYRAQKDIHAIYVIIIIYVCVWGFLHLHPHRNQNSFLIHQLIPCIINDASTALSHAANHLHIYFRIEHDNIVKFLESFLYI